MGNVNPQSYKANYSGLSAFDIAPEGRLGNLVTKPYEAIQAQKEASSIQNYRLQQKAKLQQEMAVKQAERQAQVEYMTGRAKGDYKEKFFESPEAKLANYQPDGNPKSMKDAYSEYMSKFISPYTVDNVSSAQVDDAREDIRFKREDKVADRTYNRGITEFDKTSGQKDTELAQTKAYQDSTVQQAKATLKETKKSHRADEAIKGKELSQDAKEFQTTSLQKSRELDQADTKMGKEQYENFTDENGKPKIRVTDQAGNFVKDLDRTRTVNAATLKANQLENKIAGSIAGIKEVLAGDKDFHYNPADTTLDAYIKNLARQKEGDVDAVLEHLSKNGKDLRAKSYNIEQVAQQKQPYRTTIDGKDYNEGDAFHSNIGSSTVVGPKDDKGNVTYSRKPDYNSASNDPNAFNTIKAKYADEFEDADDTFGVNKNDASKVLNFLIASGLSEADIMKTMREGDRVKSGFINSLFGDGANLPALNMDASKKGYKATLTVLADMYSEGLLKIDPNKVGKSGLNSFRISSPAYEAFGSQAEQFNEAIKRRRNSAGVKIHPAEQALSEGDYWEMLKRTFSPK